MTEQAQVIDTRQPVTAAQVHRQAVGILRRSWLAAEANQDGSVLMVDKADPTAEDGLGRTFYVEVTVREVPR